MASLMEIRKPTVIAIIDSGIKPYVSELNKNIKKLTGFKINDEGFIVQDDDIKPRHDHGTAIALIIKSLCDNVQFIDINILNEKLTTDGRVLISAMIEAVSLKPDIIHLSLGTTKWKYKYYINKIVNDAIKDNILVVSAAENMGRKSYPAYHKKVVGVKGEQFNNITDFRYYKDFYYAPYGIDNIVDADKITSKDICGNSMAAAYISGQIARIIQTEEITNYQEVIKRLKYKGLTNSKI
ncbi:hypothetical protein CSC2_35980 [Clostridium zeae]|uniref:Peptidase S8/S53 domain-containing protein n=1 Tax=Clostridium zeae TaxID=2759022 RepID=A0ABQ1EE64_9CLOT|nr:S8 family serine peptidase [Clostridium zeae]GFZ33072.1 hypothetical protein CSC2_35980 [Clostridium zeae]